MTIKTAHAGHGGIDPGAIGNGHKEADVARLYCSKLIQLTGAINATDDSAVSVNDNLNKIAANVNSVSGNDDWNISIHLNAATPSATGVEVFAFSQDSAGMAKAAEISDKLASIYNIPNRGAKVGDGLFVINNTRGHMLLIELGFISNENDLNQVLNKIDEACNVIVKSFGYSGSEQNVPQPVEPVKPKLEAVVPVGGIGVGTNVYATVPSLTSSRSPNSAFWVSNYIEGALSPYELTRDGKVVAYTTRDYIQRVNKLPVGVIPDGSNVIVNKLSDSCDKAPDKSTGYQTFWIAQYVDGNKKSAYRLVKNGITVGYTDRDNIQLVK